MDINAIIDINDLFVRKKWKRDEKNKNSLYSRFTETYKSLNVEERRAFMKTADYFTIIDINKCLEDLTSLLETVIEENFPMSKKIFVVPLISGEDSKLIKSGSIIAYFCSSLIMKYSEKIGEKNIICIDQKAILNLNKNKKIILVDDFIGSGDQALSVISYLKNFGFSEENLIILSPYIMEVGLEKIQNKNIKIFYKTKFEKCFNIKELKKYKKIIQKFEENIGIHGNNRLGFNGSEALISLLRTPNNTLSLFHDATKINKPPFPR